MAHGCDSAWQGRRLKSAIRLAKVKSLSRSYDDACALCDSLTDFTDSVSLSVFRLFQSVQYNT